MSLASFSKPPTFIDAFWGNSAQQSGVMKVRNIPTTKVCKGADILGYLQQIIHDISDIFYVAFYSHKLGLFINITNLANNYVLTKIVGKS